MVPERTSGSLKQAVLTLPLTELAQGSQNHFKETYLLLFSYRNSSLWGGNSFRSRISSGVGPTGRIETPWARRVAFPLGLPLPLSP